MKRLDFVWQLLKNNLQWLLMSQECQRIAMEDVNWKPSLWLLANNYKFLQLTIWRILRKCFFLSGWRLGCCEFWKYDCNSVFVQPVEDLEINLPLPHVNRIQVSNAACVSSSLWFARWECSSLRKPWDTIGSGSTLATQVTFYSKLNFDLKLMAPFSHFYLKNDRCGVKWGRWLDIISLQSTP